MVSTFIINSFVRSLTLKNSQCVSYRTTMATKDERTPQKGSLCKQEDDIEDDKLIKSTA
eukprot:m.1119804 g.1119804  ORF g.1119804 m.1119804 type:complete len:59 (+) comp24392_c1_seq8:2191-2367(+)